MSNTTQNVTTEAITTTDTTTVIFTTSTTEITLVDNGTTLPSILFNDTAYQLIILFNRTKELENLHAANDDNLLLITSLFVLLMQIGFPLVQYGSFRNSSTVYVLLISLFNTLFTCIMYWLVGYGFAFGGGSNKFIGVEHFAGQNVPSSSMAHWFFHFTLSATVVSIVTSSMGERASFFAYVLVTFFISAVIHPVVVHWCWNGSGWLYQNSKDIEMKYTDFAGAGVIHVCAGTCSMVSIAMAGSRAMRFDLVAKKSGHVVPLTIAGGFILFIGFLAIAVGAKGGQASAVNTYASSAVTCTLLAAGFGGLVSLACHEIQSSRGCVRRGIRPSALSSFSSFLMGCIAAMVAVSAGCDKYHLWAAVVVGTVGSLLSFGIHFLVTFLKGEDPLHTIAVHLGSGMWGLIAAPAFRLYGEMSESQHRIYQKEIGWNVAAGSSIIAWAGVLSIIMFGILKLLKLYPIEYDLKGSDILRQGQTTSPIPPGTDPYFPAFSLGNPNSRNIINRDYDLPLHQKNGANDRQQGHYGQINAMTNAGYVPEIATQL